MPSSPRIAIVGGGLAALTLGRVLQLKNAPFTIYERDASAFNRSQGGSLDLHPLTGQRALHSAKLHDKFRTQTRVETKKIGNKSEWLFEHTPKEDDESHPEIDRGHLRQIFLDVLGDNVKWNNHVKSIAKDSNGKHQLHFADGSSQVSDLIVGADGYFSTVRKLVSSARPGYTGLTFHEMFLSDADKNHPAEAATVGQGNMTTISDGKAIFAGRTTEGRIRVYAVLSVPEYWSRQVEKEYDWSNPKGEARKKLIDKFFSDWSPELQNLISIFSNDSGIWPRPIYYLPVDHQWTHVPGVTIIGDAAHVMSPFAGEGANLAMLDGAELGEAIAEGIANGGGEVLEESIRKFEERMFERASKAAIESDRNLRAFFQPGGAEKFAAICKSREKGRTPSK